MIEKIDKNYFNPENEAKRNKLKAYLVDEIDLPTSTTVSPTHAITSLMSSAHFYKNCIQTL